ncbi:hypothetical protein Tco_0407604 [Tanacetum coccineum]
MGNGKRYLSGKVNLFDWVDSDEWSVHELSDMLGLLGYKDKVVFYHFKIPNTTIDEGLKPLVTDTGVREILVTNIAQKDKNEAKRTKSSTGMERVREIKAEEATLAILHVLIDGWTWHMIQGFQMIAWGLDKIRRLGLKASTLLRL